MISITISTNTNRTTVLVPASKTPKEILQENNIDLHSGVLSLDGVPLSASEMNMSLEDLNVKESAFLTSIVKSDNAQ